MRCTPVPPNEIWEGLDRDDGNRRLDPVGRRILIRLIPR